MNSNTHNQISDNSSLSTPSITTSTHLVLHLPSTTYNPIIADFERLFRHYEQYFFYLLDQQRNYPRLPT